MGIKEQIEYWVSGTEEDFHTSQSMFTHEYYLWSLFLGHLSLKKILKGIYLKKTGNTPPYIHDLVKLAKNTELFLSPEQEQLLFEINEFQIETRYPDYKNQLRKKCTEEFTIHYLNTN